jgi:Na+-transporting NADH:ubiquinone oxidoreductase subunit C
LKDNAYTIGFAGVLSATCALLLTSAATFTKPFRDNNERVEEVLNILSALNVPLEKGESAEQLLRKFEQNVREEKRGAITLYLYGTPEARDKPRALAVRFIGPGLWGKIEGFLAVEPDLRTIRAITFSHQEETPGLGGEIASFWFRDQFVGKSLVDEAGRIGVTIGAAEPGHNSVDAITGATMTCDKLQAILDDIMTKFVEETNEQQ